MAERPDRALVRLYWPAPLRDAFDTLFAIDDAMGGVVATTSEPALGAIRLAWWRERLQELDSGIVPAEPRLTAANADLLSLGVSGRDLASLEDGWLRLFDPFPWDSSTAEGVMFRGRHLFALGARLLGSAGGQEVETAGGLWALVDAARHCSDGTSRVMLRETAVTLSQGLASHRFGKELRPLSMLSALARRDVERGEPFEAEGTPARAFTLARHSLTGRIG